MPIFFAKPAVVPQSLTVKTNNNTMVLSTTNNVSTLHTSALNLEVDTLKVNGDAGDAGQVLMQGLTGPYWGDVADIDSWVGTATSDLDMNEYGITNVTSLYVNGSSGSIGQVLSKDASNAMVWQTPTLTESNGDSLANDVNIVIESNDLATPNAEDPVSKGFTTSQLYSGVEQSFAKITASTDGSSELTLGCMNAAKDFMLHGQISSSSSGFGINASGRDLYLANIQGLNINGTKGNEGTVLTSHSNAGAPTWDNPQFVSTADSDLDMNEHGITNVTSLYVNGSSGSIGQVLSKDPSNNMAWADPTVPEVNGLSINSTNVGGGNSGFLNITDGSCNTAFGYEYMPALTTGQNNTAVGFNTMTAITTGTDNTAIGNNALSKITDSVYNTAIGSNAMRNTTLFAISNTAIGNSALFYNFYGATNVAIGNTSLLNNIYGSRNTAIGTETLIAGTNGNDNTAIGYRAGKDIIDGNHNIMIGHEGVSDDTNRIRIGNPANITNTHIPLRNASSSKSVFYDPSTCELTHANSWIGTADGDLDMRAYDISSNSYILNETGFSSTDASGNINSLTADEGLTGNQTGGGGFTLNKTGFTSTDANENINSLTKTGGLQINDGYNTLSLTADDGLTGNQTGGGLYTLNKTGFTSTDANGNVNSLTRTSGLQINDGNDTLSLTADEGLNTGYGTGSRGQVLTKNASNNMVWDNTSTLDICNNLTDDVTLSTSQMDYVYWVETGDASNNIFLPTTTVLRQKITIRNDSAHTITISAQSTNTIYSVEEATTTDLVSHSALQFYCTDTTADAVNWIII